VEPGAILLAVKPEEFSSILTEIPHPIESPKGGSTVPALRITDPVESPGLFEDRFSTWVRPLLHDRRDASLVRTALKLTLCMVVPGCLLFVPGVFRWWMAPIYAGLYFKFIAPYTLLLHCVSHRPLFRRKPGGLDLNVYIPWVIGPFFGHAPETYFVHHIGMHHAEGNSWSDLSSTLRYQRDSFRDFLRYEIDFLFLGIPKLLRYLIVRRRTKLALRLIRGELAFVLLAIGAVLWNPGAGLTVFAGTFLLTRVLLMTGNWAQHAFVDPDHLDNDYRTVVTFVNSSYNRRGFNDGYHLTHHLKPTLHYLEMPLDFLDRRGDMIRMNSLVFRELDYFRIFLLLMLKRHDTLARYVVELDPEHPRTREETAALIKHRLRRVEPATP
jgi:hypothetical protein